MHILMHQTHDFNIDLGTIEQPKRMIFPNLKVYFYKWIDIIDLHVNIVSELVFFHSKPLSTSYSFGRNTKIFSLAIFS